MTTTSSHNVALAYEWIATFEDRRSWHAIAANAPHTMCDRQIDRDELDDTYPGPKGKRCGKCVARLEKFAGMRDALGGENEA